MLKIKKLILPGPLLIQPKVFHDKRGFLYETWNEKIYHNSNIKNKIVQVICSHSKKKTLRGIHFQYPNLQGKFISVIDGRIFDVIVDIRKKSPNFGKWCGLVLDSKKKQQLWIPEGFGHGYLVLSQSANIIYKCTCKYYPKNQQSIIWNDPDLKIKWPTQTPLLSPKDMKAKKLRDHKKLPEWKKKN